MLDDFIASVAEFVDELVDENNSVVWTLELWFPSQSRSVWS